MRTGANPDAIGELLLLGGLGLAGFVLLFVFGWWLRRRTLGDGPTATSNPLDLANLQRLRDAGTISEQEYKVLRAAAIRSLGGDGGR